METNRSGSSIWPAQLPAWADDALDLLAWSATHVVSPRLTARMEEAETSAVEELRRRKIDGLWHLATDRACAEQRIYDRIWRAQRAALLEVIDALTQAGVQPIVFKGAEALEAWYGGHAFSLMADLDLLVLRTELATVKQILFGAGYRQMTFHPPSGTFVDRDVADVAALEGSHYELAPFNRLQPVEVDEEEGAVIDVWNDPKLRRIDGRYMMLVEFDVHHGIASDVGTEDLFARAVPSAFGNARTFCHADQVWFLTSRLYTEVAIHAKDSLRDFAYVLPVLRRGVVDWDVVVSVARELDLRPSLYYYLHFMNALSGGAVPAGVFEALCPTRGSRVRDWGWQLGRLLGIVDPCPVKVG